jgi:hypothetical protein
MPKETGPAAAVVTAEVTAAVAAPRERRRSATR